MTGIDKINILSPKPGPESEPGGREVTLALKEEPPLLPTEKESRILALGQRLQDQVAYALAHSLPQNIQAMQEIWPIPLFTLLPNLSGEQVELIIKQLEESRVIIRGSELQGFSRDEIRGLARFINQPLTKRPMLGHSSLEARLQRLEEVIFTRPLDYFEAHKIPLTDGIIQLSFLADPLPQHPDAIRLHVNQYSVSPAPENIQLA